MPPYVHFDGTHDRCCRGRFLTDISVQGSTQAVTRFGAGCNHGSCQIRCETREGIKLVKCVHFQAPGRSSEASQPTSWLHVRPESTRSCAKLKVGVLRCWISQLAGDQFQMRTVSAFSILWEPSRS